MNDNLMNLYEKSLNFNNKNEKSFDGITNRRSTYNLK